MKVICEAATNCSYKTCPAKVEHEPIIMLDKNGDWIMCHQNPTFCSHSRHDQICKEVKDEEPTA